MYAVYRQTDPSTSAELAEYCNFFGTRDRQLVVYGGMRLRVYRLNPYVLQRDSETGAYQQETKLECVLSVPMLAPVKGMQSGKVPSVEGDCLFLAFEQAKLSIVAYDPPNHDLKTVSLHCFEEEYLKGGYTKDFPLPIVRCDPDNRCAAMLCYGAHLGVVPYTLTSDIVLDDLLDYSSSHRNRRPSQRKDAAGLFSYSFSLLSVDERLLNVADMCFLSGYFEPTLLILYEPNQTTAGRAAVRQDTYCIIGISINTKDRVQSPIWNVSLLPFDCLRCLAVPKPIGGVIVLAANSIIYLNQSVPAYAIATNSNMRGMTGFPLRSDHEDKKITMDCCALDFILPSTVVFTTSLGKLFVLTMLIDSTNVVRGMHLEAAATSSTPCCAAALEDGYFFIGSRLADSMLFRYSETDHVSIKVAHQQPVSPTNTGDKRRRLSDDAHGKRNSTNDVMDDFALYGEIVTVQTLESMPVSRYTFECCDAVSNLGNCREIAVTSPSPELQSVKFDQLYDVVFATGGLSGIEHDSAIVQLQRTVRPQVSISSEIAGASQIWTVGRTEEEDHHHQYMLVSKEVVTMVLQVKDEIAELEMSGFIMDQRTVAAGELDGGKLIVQVTPMWVVLLRGCDRIQEMALDINFPVCQASIVDPFISLLTENGEILVVQATVTDDRARRQLVLTRPPIQQVAAWAATVYRDSSGMFVTSTETGTDAGLRPTASSSETKNDQSQTVNAVGSVFDPNEMMSSAAALHEAMSVEDEDALLYGEIDNSFTKAMKSEPSNRIAAGDVFFEGSVPFSANLADPNTIMSTYWLVVSRENGMLEIFSLPDCQPVYFVQKFPYGHKVLYDTGVLQSGGAQQAEDSFPPVKEISMVGLGHNNARPFIFAVVHDQLLVYEAFAYDAKISDHLAVRFRRCETPIIPRDSKMVSKLGRRQMRQEQSEFETSLRSYPKVVNYFEGIDVYNSGVFICGAYPYWVLLSRGELRAHPMTMDGAVKSFTSFNNQHCPSGFMYLAEDDNRISVMRVAQLDATFDYDRSYPARRTSMGSRVVHFIEYLLESNTWALVTSQNKRYNKVMSLVGDEKQMDAYEKPDEPNFLFPTIDCYQLQLCFPDSFELIPEAGEIEMEEMETVTAMKEVGLKSEGTASGLQSYCALTTIYNYGEEMMVRGRILIVEVIEVVPDVSTPLNKNKLKLLYAKDQKGPASSLCACQGYLLTGMGQKVYIWQFKDNDLIGISFIDLHFYVHQMVGLRNLALVADVYHSISLLRYQERYKALSLASRDFKMAQAQPVPLGIEFLVDSRQLGFLSSDEDCNISLFCYQPETKESLGGQRLVPRGDVNIGARVNRFLRLRAHISDDAVENKHQAVGRHFALFGTLDGAVGVITPLSEKVFRRLHMVQNVMATYVAHAAGINPRASRGACGARRFSANLTPQTSRNVVDGDLVWPYLYLSSPERHELAKRLGTTCEQIFDDLLELQRVTTHF